MSNSQIKLTKTGASDVGFMSTGISPELVMFDQTPARERGPSTRAIPTLSGKFMGEAMAHCGLCPPSEPKHCAAGEIRRMQEISEQLSLRPITVCDIPAKLVCEDREVRRDLRNLIVRLGVPEECRTRNDPTGGYWLLDRVTDLRKTLEVEGSQILIATDQHLQLLGFYIYHLRPDNFSPSDKKLVEAVEDAKIIPNNAPYGIAHMVGVDHLVREAVAEGGLGLSRSEVLLVMHTNMIREAREKKIPYLVGYYRTEPAANTAVDAHQRMGWQMPEGVRFESVGRVHDAARNVVVKNQVVWLEVNSPVQDQLMDQVRNIKAIRFLDLDPLPIRRS